MVFKRSLLIAIALSSVASVFSIYARRPVNSVICSRFSPHIHQSGNKIVEAKKKDNSWDELFLATGQAAQEENKISAQLLKKANKQAITAQKKALKKAKKMQKQTDELIDKCTKKAQEKVLQQHIIAKQQAEQIEHEAKVRANKILKDVQQEIVIISSKARQEELKIKKEADQQAIALISQAVQQALAQKIGLKSDAQSSINSAQVPIALPDSQHPISQSWRNVVKQSFSEHTSFIQAIILQAETDREEQEEFSNLFLDQEHWFTAMVDAVKIFFDDAYHRVMNKKEALERLVIAQKEADSMLQKYVEILQLKQAMHNHLRLMLLYDINALSNAEDTVPDLILSRACIEKMVNDVVARRQIYAAELEKTEQEEYAPVIHIKSPVKTYAQHALEKKEKEIIALEAKLGKEQEKMEQLEIQADIFKKKIMELSTNLLEQKKENDLTKDIADGQLDQIKNEYTSVSKQVAAGKERIQSLQQKLHNQREKSCKIIEKKNEDLVDVQIALQRAKEQITSFKESVETFKIQRNQAQQKTENAMQQLSSFKRREELHQDQIENEQRMIHQALQLNKILEKQLDQQQKSLQTLQSDAEQALDEIDHHYQEKMAQAQGETKELFETLDGHYQEKLEGIEDTLNIAKQNDEQVALLRNSMLEILKQAELGMHVSRQIQQKIASKLEKKKKQLLRKEVELAKKESAFAQSMYDKVALDSMLKIREEQLEKANEEIESHAQTLQSREKVLQGREEKFVATVQKHTRELESIENTLEQSVASLTHDSVDQEAN